MKKILTVSLVAMMAVSTARADIASSAYVDARTGDVANSNYVKTLTNKTLTGAVDDLDSRIDDLTGDAGILSGLDLATVSATGKAIVSVTQSDGKVTATTGEINSAGIANGTVAKEDLTAAVQASLGKADSAMQSIAAGSVTKTMLDSSVQTSLGKADTAMQSIAAGSVTKAMLNDSVQASLGKADTTAANIVQVDAGGSLTEAQKGSTTLYPSMATTSKMISDANVAVDQKLQQITNDEDGILAQAKGYTNTQVNGLDLATVSATGKAIVSVTQSDGKVTATTGEINSAGIANGTVAKEDLTDTVQASLNKADSALQSIAAGSVTKTMLDSSVQTSLGKADTAMQSIATGSVTKTMLDSSVQTSLGKADTAMQSIANGSVTKTMLNSSVQTSLGKADSAMQETGLKSLASWTEQGCATAGVTCSLIATGGTIAWEKVAR